MIKGGELEQLTFYYLTFCMVAVHEGKGFYGGIYKDT